MSNAYGICWTGLVHRVSTPHTADAETLDAHSEATQNRDVREARPPQERTSGQRHPDPNAGFNAQRQNVKGRSCPG